MKAREENGQIKIYGQLPKTWKNHLNFSQASIELQQQEGFYDVVTPEYDPKLQELGPIYFDEVNKVFTYPVVDKTPEEIEAEKPPILPSEKDLTKDSLRSLILQMLKDFGYVKNDENGINKGKSGY